jgi:hypothetical protein
MNLIFLLVFVSVVGDASGTLGNNESSANVSPFEGSVASMRMSIEKNSREVIREY